MIPNAARALVAVSLLAANASPAFAQAESSSEAAVTSSFPSTSNAGYQIRPGDLISVSVYNEPSLSQAGVRVLPGGLIQEPLAGPVRVSGLTPVQAGAAVGRALRKYLRNPSVTVAVAAVAPVDVYVLGNVKTPGKYQLQPDSRLMDALAAAGGLGPTDGDLPDARLDTGNGVQTVSLQKLLHQGDLTLNTPIRNQMTVYVPSPTVFNVFVAGAVDHGGEIPMHEGDRLVNAIARAGTSTGANADLNHVVVSHRTESGIVTKQTVNMYDIYKNGDARNDIILAKGDSVYVPQGRGRSNATDTLNPLTSILYTLMHL